MRVKVLGRELHPVPILILAPYTSTPWVQAITFEGMHKCGSRTLRLATADLHAICHSNLSRLTCMQSADIQPEPPDLL